MAAEASGPFYEPVALTVTSGTLLFGDKPEVIAGCEPTRRGRIALKTGTYRVLYKPALLLIIKDTCTRDQVDDFIRSINARAGHIYPRGPMYALGVGRSGCCVSGYLDDKEEDREWYGDGIYVACDELVDHGTVAYEVSKEAINRSREEGHIVSFADGRGISVSTGSKRKYLVKRGNQMVASLGAKMCIEDLIVELDKVWPRHITKAAI